MAMVGGGEEWKKRDKERGKGDMGEGIIIRIFQKLRYNCLGFRGDGNIIKLQRTLMIHYIT